MIQVPKLCNRKVFALSSGNSLNFDNATAIHGQESTREKWAGSLSGENGMTLVS